KLAKDAPRRRARIAPIGFAPQKREHLPRQFAAELLQYALALHENHHESDPKTGHRVRFGLIRMANIGPLFDVARALYTQDAAKDVRIHLCVYHSQFPLLLRSAIEKRLDAALDRRQPEAVYDLADIRRHLDASPEPDQLFIVLGSPVTEVGRDHDYDWAVVEPSSMRSIIQLAGRVRRHRDRTISDYLNIALLGAPFRAMKSRDFALDKPVFHYPGFETKEALLHAHKTAEVISPEALQSIDSIPRIMRQKGEMVDGRYEIGRA